MNRSELIQEAVELLVGDPEISSHEWDHLAIVAQVGEMSSDASGFAYLENGNAISTGPENFEFLDRVMELREVMREPGKDQWRAVLIRVSRATESFTADFEYDQPSKWSITSENVGQMAEVLRPIL